MIPQVLLLLHRSADSVCMHHLILTAGLHSQPACRRLARRMHMYMHDVMYCQRQTKKWWQTESKNHATTVSAQLLKHQCMMLITMVQSESLCTFLECCEITMMRKYFTFPWAYHWLIYNIQTRLTPYSLRVIQLETYTISICKVQQLFDPQVPQDPWQYPWGDHLWF